MKKIILAIAIISSITNINAQVTDTGNNVGIGIANPSSKLHITDAGTSSVYSLQLNNRFKFRGDGVMYWGSNADYGILSWENSKTYVGALYGKNFGLYANGTEKMTISKDGDVGIGITTPSEKLEIFNSNTTPGTISLRSSRNDARNVDVGRLAAKQGTTEVSRIGMPRAGGTYTGFLTFWTKETNDSPLKESMRIKENGYIGIGTVAPSHNLDISNTSTLRNVGLELDASHYTGTGTSHSFIQLKTPNYKADNVLTNGAAEIGLSNSTGALYITRKTNIGSNGHGIVLDKNANIGIGTSTPNSKLQIMNGNNGVSFDASDSWIGIGFNRSVKNGQIFNSSKSGWQFTARDERFSLEGYNGANNNLLNILKNGNIGIGTISTGGHKLAVEGSIGAREIKVETTSWPDYVFTNEYKLLSLKEVEKHIKTNGHLPNIPSAKQVKKNGVYLGKMDAKLLQKIEELTLYTIQQDKKLEKQNKEIEELKALVKKLIDTRK